MSFLESLLFRTNESEKSSHKKDIKSPSVDGKYGAINFNNNYEDIGYDMALAEEEYQEYLRESTASSDDYFDYFPEAREELEYKYESHWGDEKNMKNKWINSEDRDLID